MTGPANHLHRHRKWPLWSKIVLGFFAAAVGVLLAASGLAGFTAAKVSHNMVHSNALASIAPIPKLTQDTNILVMGLDSRVDEQGNPLSPALYDALDAGDQSIGGYNANVLMLVHIPADGGQATAISIPRDDYVQIAGIPGESFDGKIKEA
ncbi:LCP family protein [Arthrobacter sp. GMC3]|uniref:LCP family glycopolymer transferase n=1 Tax=Arthrobacter sp. GMC3 TaxID=2058894 RepID=UPI000CE2B736|nr:LCP family protein [Arthrobacter sp. GMC3]